MTKAFLKKAEEIGGESLVQFIKEHKIETPQQLIAALRQYVSTVKSAAERAPPPKERDPTTLGSTPDVISQGFSTNMQELSHLNHILPRLEEEFGTS